MSWSDIDESCLNTPENRLTKVVQLSDCVSVCVRCVFQVSVGISGISCWSCVHQIPSNQISHSDVMSFFFLPVLSPFATWEIFALSAVIHVLFITRGNKPLELYYVVARQQSDLNANWYRQEVMLHQLGFAVSLVAAGFKCCSRKPTTSYLWQSPSFF